LSPQQQQKVYILIYRYSNYAYTYMIISTISVTTRTVSGSAASKNISPLAKFKQLDKAAAQQQAQK